MSAAYVDEESPLLGEESSNFPAASRRSAIERVHFLDNLRAVLTVLLIFHHASINASFESLWPTHSKGAVLPLALFITTNKSFLYGLFFFVSGYSIHLGLQAKSDLAFLTSRAVKTGLPAFLYAHIGQNILVKLGRLFGALKPTAPGWYPSADRMEGPVAYVVTLLLLDSIYLFTRYAGRNYPQLSFARLESRVKDSRRAVHALFLFSIILVTGITIGNCFGLRLVPFIYRRHVRIEFPGFGAPVTYIIAYIAGVNFLLLKRYILISKPAFAVAFLAHTEACAFIALGVAQHLSTPLWDFVKTTTDSEGARFFVDAGLNGHTAFFSLWNPFVFYCLSIGTISVFVSVPVLGRNWGVWTKHTYTQTFVHMVPIVILSRLLAKSPATDYPIVKALLSAIFAVIVSWAVGLGVLRLRDAVVEKMGWRMPVDIDVRARYSMEGAVVGDDD